MSMPPSSDMGLPKTRLYSRAGCSVCKTRKLKCDETKPACERCLAAGWKCEYVAVRSVARRPLRGAFPESTSASIYRPVIQISPHAQHQKSFYSFQRAAELDVTSFFTNRSWSHVVLQMSYHEPAVKHAVFALGALLASMVLPNPVIDNGDSASHVLGHYTLALSHLRESPASTRQSRRTILALCLCFTWIDLLRQELDSAYAHVQAGVAIVHSALTEGHDEIEPCLVHALQRMHTQARFYGSPSFRLDMAHYSLASHKENPYLFDDLSEGRARLDGIYASTVSLMRHTKQATGSSRLPETSDPPRRSSMALAVESQRYALTTWRDGWKASAPSRIIEDRRKHDAARCLLEMQYNMQLVILDSLDDASEASFERHIREFENILDFAETFLELMTALGLFPLSFEAGLIPPLSLVNMKCPVISLRIRALELLKRCPSQESLWNRDKAVEISQWKLEKEARGRSEHYCLPAAARIHSESFSLRMIDGKMTPFVSYKVGSCKTEIMEVLDGRMSGVSASMGDMI